MLDHEPHNSDLLLDNQIMGPLHYLGNVWASSTEVGKIHVDPFGSQHKTQPIRVQRLLDPSASFVRTSEFCFISCLDVNRIKIV